MKRFGYGPRGRLVWVLFLLVVGTLSIGMASPPVGALTLARGEPTAAAAPGAPRLTAPGACAPGLTPLTLFSEDFETGATRWHTEVATGSDTWGVVTSNPHSGMAAMYAKDVPTVSEQWLTSPPITLPTNAAPLTLEFWNEQRLESIPQGGCFDAGLLDISTDDGATWSQIPNSALLTDPYDGEISTLFSNPRGGDDGWCGDPQAYIDSIVALDAYAGQTVRFRFILTTDQLHTRGGWWLDDVRVQSCPTTRPQYLPLQLR